MFGQSQEMEAEELDNQLLEPAPVPAGRIAQHEALPSVPTSRPTMAKPQAAKPAKTAEELELEALEAEMAL